MMKRSVILHTLLGVCLFTACQQERLGETETAADAAELKLTVLAANFLPADNASTRAIDNGSVTVFENGDRVGLIILGSDGVPVVDNLPYTFDGAGWTTSGTVQYYDAEMETCIVYYPYDERANGVTGVEELKDLFYPAEDQSSEEGYRQSDLMVANGAAAQEMTVTLEHVYSSCSFSFTVNRTLDDESEICYVPNSLEDMIFQDGEGKRIYPYQAEDGSFRYILPVGYTGTIRWFYTYMDKRYNSTMEISGASANTRYSKAYNMSMGKYTLDNATAGDFLCMKADGTLYLVPEDTGFLPGHTCIGIVFKSGTGNGDDAGNYGGKPDSIHGYAVALKDASSEAGAWGIRGTDVQDLENVSSLSGTYDGYSNTLAVRSLAEYGTTDINNPTANDQYWAFKAASEYDVTVPENTSGWYLPSIAQLEDIYNLPDRSDIFGNAGGENFNTWSNEGRYWSSTEYNYYDAWYCQFDNGSVTRYAKSNNGGDYLRPSYVRAVLTF